MTLLASVRREIVDHLPVDAHEHQAKETILQELDRLEDPFDEHADLVHVTGSAIIVGPRGTILHLHRRLHRWMQTGGHVDSGESPAEAALRESLEETGLGLRHPEGGPVLVHVDVHRAARGHTHLDLRYLLLGEDADPAPPPGESQDVRWFTWDDAIHLVEEPLQVALRSAHQIASRIVSAGDPFESESGLQGTRPQDRGA